MAPDARPARSRSFQPSSSCGLLHRELLDDERQATACDLAACQLRSGKMPAHEADDDVFVIDS